MGRVQSECTLHATHCGHTSMNFEKKKSFLKGQQLAISHKAGFSDFQTLSVQ